MKQEIGVFLFTLFSIMSACLICASEKKFDIIYFTIISTISILALILIIIS